jgi:hypothetical protein
MTTISKKEFKAQMEKKEKYNQLVRFIKSKIGKPLTDEEERFLNWLCVWDEETYRTFKGLLEAISRQMEKKPFLKIYKHEEEFVLERERLKITFHSEASLSMHLRGYDLSQYEVECDFDLIYKIN